VFPSAIISDVFPSAISLIARTLPYPLNEPVWLSVGNFQAVQAKKKVSYSKLLSAHLLLCLMLICMPIIVIPGEILSLPIHPFLTKTSQSVVRPRFIAFQMWIIHFDDQLLRAASDLSSKDSSSANRVVVYRVYRWQVIG
jgi:hypothetical protein